MILELAPVIKAIKPKVVPTNTRALYIEGNFLCSSVSSSVSPTDILLGIHSTARNLTQSMELSFRRTVIIIKSTFNPRVSLQPPIIVHSKPILLFWLWVLLLWQFWCLIHCHCVRAAPNSPNRPAIVVTNRKTLQIQFSSWGESILSLRNRVNVQLKWFPLKFLHQKTSIDCDHFELEKLITTRDNWINFCNVATYGRRTVCYRECPNSNVRFSMTERASHARKDLHIKGPLKQNIYSWNWRHRDT